MAHGSALISYFTTLLDQLSLHRGDDTIMTSSPAREPIRSLANVCLTCDISACGLTLVPGDEVVSVALAAAVGECLAALSGHVVVIPRHVGSARPHLHRLTADD